MDGLQMNAATNQKVNELLQYIADSVKSGGDMLAKEAPEVAKEIVAWQARVATISLIEDAAWVVCGALLVALAVWVTRKGLAILRNDKYGDGHVPLFMLAAVCGLVGTIVCVCNISSGVGNYVRLSKCSTAPRLVVIDYLRK